MEGAKLENIKVPRGQLAANCSYPICNARKTNPVRINSTKSENKIQTKSQEINDQNKLNEEEINSCSKCFQERIGPGLSHKCTEINRRKNLAELVFKEKGKEKIVAKVLKQVIQ